MSDQQSVESPTQPNLARRFQECQRWLGSRILGQQALVDRLLMALVTGGHLLVEGPPGLAKTRAIKELASIVHGDFHRIQFTPDLLPSDVTGTEIYRPQDGSFVFQQGPIFNNVLLADEVNRAPAKVQSALLEAMAEGQVSVGRTTYPLPELFMVMATQNPIEQEGTYPLPEAQLDRFLMHVEVNYPDSDAEAGILALVRAEQGSTEMAEPPVQLSQQDVFDARQAALAVYMADSVERYLIALVQATRAADGPVARYVDFGASPRATIALDQCARAGAWLAGRDHATPADVQAAAHDVLRHRVLLTFEADAQGITSNQVIDELLNEVPVP
ncbi:MAG: MoxR family ATPase [Pseudomonadaceae bacterium]|nr:MoxR family ATPase [Pseudomonadaceae bacterium]